jgi:hypothetical protein
MTTVRYGAASRPRSSGPVASAGPQVAWFLRHASRLNAALSQPGVPSSNGINGALMPFPRHRWNIDAVARGQAGWPAGATGRMRPPIPSCTARTCISRRAASRPGRRAGRQATTPARVAHPGPWPRATRLRLTPPRIDLLGRRGEGAPPAPSSAAPVRPPRAAVNRPNHPRKRRSRPVPREHQADPCAIPAGPCKILPAKRGRLTPPPRSPVSRCRRNRYDGTSSGCSARAPRTTGRPPPGSS